MIAGLRPIMSLALLTALTCTSRDAAPHPPSEPVLLAAAGEAEGRPVALGELRAAAREESIELYDVVYGKPKRYLALPLGEALAALLGEEWNEGRYTEVVFHASDGYEAVAPTSLVAEAGGYLAFRDLEFPDWEPVGRHQASPGPFYVVWQGAEQTTEHGYPWPYQVAEVRLARFAEHYPRVYPEGLNPDSIAWRGFEIFRQRCIRCHSINREGGKIGPDLNAPRSIASYRSEEMIRELIRRPSEYRYTRMPDHRDLSDADLDGLIAYFQEMERRGGP